MVQEQCRRGRIGQVRRHFYRPNFRGRASWDGLEFGRTERSFAVSGTLPAFLTVWSSRRSIVSKMEWLLSPSLLALSLILLIKQGLCDKRSSTESGILCYSCNSHDDPRCGNPFQAHHFTPVNCSDLNYMDDYGQKMLKVEKKDEPNLCRKNYQTVTLGGKTDTRIVRGCGYMAKNKAKYGVEEEEEDFETGEDRCYRKAGTFEVMVTYCTCTKSKCNGATPLDSDLALPLVVLGVVSLCLNLPVGL